MTQEVHINATKAQLVEVKAGISIRESIDVDPFIRMLSEIAKRVASADNQAKQEDEQE